MGAIKAIASSDAIITRVLPEIPFQSPPYPITLLEIGLRHPLERSYSAIASLRVWRDYFPKARLIAFDIDDFRDVCLSNCCMQGDMSSQLDLSQLFTLGPFDIIIDDASHVSAHQQIGLACLFPHLKPSGLYFIEDLHWQRQDLERADVPQTRVLLRARSFESPVISAAEAQYLARNVESVQLFNTRDTYCRDRRDALGVIRKSKQHPKNNGDQHSRSD
jgi:hypothetical protein